MFAHSSCHRARRENSLAVSVLLKTLQRHLLCKARNQECRTDQGYVDEYAIYNNKSYTKQEEFKEDFFRDNFKSLCDRFQYSPLVFEENSTKPELEANSRAKRFLDEYLNMLAEKYFSKAIIIDINKMSSEN